VSSQMGKSGVGRCLFGRRRGRDRERVLEAGMVTGLGLTLGGVGCCCFCCCLLRASLPVGRVESVGEVEEGCETWKGSEFEFGVVGGSACEDWRLLIGYECTKKVVEDKIDLSFACFALGAGVGVAGAVTSCFGITGCRCWR
jgi:hypothetical protein